MTTAIIFSSLAVAGALLAVTAYALRIIRGLQTELCDTEKALRIAVKETLEAHGHAAALKKALQDVERALTNETAARAAAEQHAQELMATLDRADPATTAAILREELKKIVTLGQP